MSDFFNNVWGHLTNKEFLLGMLLAALLLVIVYIVVKLVLKCSKKLDRISIQDDGGNFVICRPAFQNFLTGVLKAVPGVTLKNVRLRQLPEDKIRVNLYLGAEPGADIIKIHDTLRSGILREIAEKLGVKEQIGELNLMFTSLPPSNELKADASVALSQGADNDN